MGQHLPQPDGRGQCAASKAAAARPLSEVDSAGTHGYHAGDPPRRTQRQAHAAKRGYDLSALRARKLTAADFEHFDLVLGMMTATCARRAASARLSTAERLKLLMDFAPRLISHIVPGPITTTAPPRLNRCWTSSKQLAMGWCATCSAAEGLEDSGPGAQLFGRWRT